MMTHQLYQSRRCVMCVILLVAFVAQIVHSKRIAIGGSGSVSQAVVFTSNVLDGQNPGGVFTTSMQFGNDGDAPNDAAVQTTNAMQKISKIFDQVAAAMNRPDVSLVSAGTSCLLYLANTNDFSAASAAYKVFFPQTPHPTRSPTVIGLVNPNAANVNAVSPPLAAVTCSGTLQPLNRFQEAPPNFFPDDFNSQGIAIDSTRRTILYTAGQIGADPVSGIVVPGGAANETKQAFENLEVVVNDTYAGVQKRSNAYGAVFDDHVVSCNVMIDSLLVPDWSVVLNVVTSIFGSAQPVLAVTGSPNGAIGDTMMADCTAVTTQLPRFKFYDISNNVVATITGDGSTLQFLFTAPITAYTQIIAARASGSAQMERLQNRRIEIAHNNANIPHTVETQTQIALATLNVLFVKSFGTTIGFFGAAVDCTLLVTDASNVIAAQHAYQLFFASAAVAPTLTTKVLSLQSQSTPTESPLVAVQCFGASAFDG